MSTTGELSTRDPATASAPPPSLPEAATADPGKATEQAETRHLSVGEYQNLAAHARTHGLTPGDTLRTAVAAILATWSRHPAFTLSVRGREPDHRTWPVDVDLALPFDQLVRELPTGPGSTLPLTVAVPGAADRDRLTCTLSPYGGDLRVAWWVDRGHQPGLAGDLADGLHEFLLDLAADPAAFARADRELLPRRQRETRERVNDTTAPVPELLLHEPFWRQTDATPDRPAVITDERTVTYRQLRHAAARLAHDLLTFGTRPGELVAVVMDKGWEQCAATLAINAAGAAYVPIMPDLPTDRLHHLLDVADVRTVLTQPHLRDTVPWPRRVRVVPVDPDFAPPPGETTFRRRQGPDDLAYVIFTSGSTGTPKGVMISHRAATNTIVDINRRFAVGPDDRVLALSSLSFDLSVYDIFGLLAVGGAVVVPTPGSDRAPWSWLDSLRRHGVTVWDTVPALMEMLVTFTEARHERIPESLRLVMMSGDWIPVTLPDRLRAIAAPDLAVIGLGGATEASIWSNFYPIGQVDPRWPSIPYGTPLANQHFDVLDAALRQRPAGVPGDLYIGGTGVALGYWKDPHRTAASFITHPHTGRRLYRTGDLGRYLPDGTLEFLGRDDFQVKINGFRVELGEIETALLAHPAVTAAAVCALGARHADKHLAAYVTLDTGTDRRDPTALVSDLRAHLRQRLPAYLVPPKITVLDQLPLTPNGKVDRTTLANTTDPRP